MHKFRHRFIASGLTGLLLAATQSSFAQDKPATGSAPSASADHASRPAIVENTLTAYHPATDLPAPAQFVTHHQIVIRGKTLQYTAIAGDTFLTNPSGDVIGSFFSFSYIKDSPASEQRPVMFVFNGGPGSASIWLQMGVVGPKHAVLSDLINPSVVPPFKLEDNPNCLLDVADIVFIDPIGTGYSRILGKGTPKDFFGVDEDVSSVAQFMERWLDKHNRWNSPKFVMGESYGSFRAAILPRALMGGPTYMGVMRGITLNGIVLLGTTLGQGPGMNAETQLWHEALELPGEAATAWYQGKVDKNGQSLSDYFESADHYARTTYIEALRKDAAGTLDKAERDAVAQKLAAFTGLAVTDIPKNLKLQAHTFETKLLADKNLTVGAYDSRYTLPTLHSGNEPVADDPAMGQYVPGFVAAFHQMLIQDLKIDLDRPYGAIVWQGILAGWNWNRAGVPPGQSAAVDLGVAMRRDSALKVLVGAGYYDLVTSAATARHDLEEAGISNDRMTFKVYESGHMLYVGKTAGPFSDDVRALIRSASK
jgi:carboxypeptidase C (cathepsin A)